MKLSGGMYYPDGEAHMIEWNAKHGVEIMGRVIYQWKKQAAVYARCAQRRTAIDVGAHVGHWSINMAARFEKVIAFEPVAEHADCFERNVLADGANPHVHLMRCACGASPGSVAIHRMPGNSGGSHVKGLGDIPMLAIDSLALEDVDLIKMDVEGYEANVIAGARETLLRCKPIVCCEQKRDFACKFGLKATAATDALKALGMRQIEEIGGDFIMGW